jgi:hypothetical protein
MRSIRFSFSIKQLRFRHVWRRSPDRGGAFRLAPRPHARAHQQIEIRDAVELRLLVEQRFDPLLAVAVAA